MATSRQRGNRWEFCIRRKGVLPKPVWLSFASEDEGEAYCARIERLLDSGVVPEELSNKAQPLTTINLAYERYDQFEPISDADTSYWPVILKRWGLTRIATVDYSWVERQVTRCKDEFKLSPSTIRHQMGAMARLWDWLLKRQAVATNPFRLLRKGYASGVKKDIERDRRPSGEEIARLIGALDGDMLILVLLAIETAMRMREMYTLTVDQIDLRAKTVFLEKTKNGDKRQVPLSSVAIELLGNIPRSGPIFPELWDGDTNKLSMRRTTSRHSVAFGRAAEEIVAPDLRFHDLRHEATCRLYERTALSDLQIAKITGHKDMKQLMRYANLRGSDLANSLW
jgi:integrase